ncbi:MAG: hypothetical protein AAF098_09075 [Pseudomonadota bacterium]
MKTPTVVLQSQDEAALGPWQLACLKSVRQWSKGLNYAYRFENNEFFDRIPTALKSKYQSHMLLLSDLARLLWLREALDEGFDSAIWCDADLLIFDNFVPTSVRESFGRECWVQQQGSRLRSYKKVHNAWLCFHRSSPLLSFYIDRALCLLEHATPPLVPQFLGPKLLTAWHNIVPFNVEEQVGMLSPLCARDLLCGGNKSLELLRAGHSAPIKALNLAASYEGRHSDGVCHGPDEYSALVNHLKTYGCCSRP